MPRLSELSADAREHRDAAIGVGTAAGAGLSLLAARRLTAAGKAQVLHAAADLNRMARQQSSVDLGMRATRNMFGHYVLSGKRIPPPALRDSRPQSRAADWWSSDLKHVNRIREGKAPKVIGRRSYREMRSLIDSAKPVDRELHRGIRGDQSAYHAGQRINLPESSWTEDPRITDMYAMRRRFKGEPVVFHMTGGPAVHVAPLTRYRNSEWVTPRSSFEITHTDVKGGTKHVYLRPVSKAARSLRQLVIGFDLRRQR